MGTFDDVARLENAIRRGKTRRERIEDGLDQEWYTVLEAAEVLDEHPKTLYERIRKGEIVADTRRPRKTRIHYTDLAKFMSQDRKKS